MALRPLHLLGSPVLRERAAEIAAVDDELKQLIDDMFETMDAAQGVGLAANQIGIARRVAVIDAEGRRFAMVNPVVVEATGKASAEEGCLSIPDIFSEVSRPERVILEAIGRDGQPFQLEATGLTARAIQHEIDHLDGILFLDHLGPIRRKMLMAKWKKEHKNDATYIKPVEPPSGRQAG